MAEFLDGCGLSVVAVAMFVCPHGHRHVAQVSLTERSVKTCPECGEKAWANHNTLAYFFHAHRDGRHGVWPLGAYSSDQDEALMGEGNTLEEAILDVAGKAQGARR